MIEIAASHNHSMETLLSYLQKQNSNNFDLIHFKPFKYFDKQLASNGNIFSLRLNPLPTNGKHNRTDGIGQVNNNMWRYMRQMPSRHCRLTTKYNHWSFELSTRLLLQRSNVNYECVRSAIKRADHLVVQNKTRPICTWKCRSAKTVSSTKLMMLKDTVILVPQTLPVPSNESTNILCTKLLISTNMVCTLRQAINITMLNGPVATV